MLVKARMSLITGCMLSSSSPSAFQTRYRQRSSSPQTFRVLPNLRLHHLVEYLLLASIVIATTCDCGLDSPNSDDFINYNNKNPERNYDSKTEQQQVFVNSINITQLIYTRFHQLFQENLSNQTGSAQQYQHQQQQQQQQQQPLENSFVKADQDNQPFSQLQDSPQRPNQEQQDQQQSQLETRKIIDENEILFSRQGNQLNALNSEDRELNKRNYIRVLNKVFARVDLPDLYKASQSAGSNTQTPAGTRLIRGSGGSANNHCGLHIGCIEEIPNFPSLLRKSNVSSSFTLYTRENSKLGYKINYEPIIHHQLQDSASAVNVSELEKLQDKLQENRHAQHSSSNLGNINNQLTTNSNNINQNIRSNSFNSANNPATSYTNSSNNLASTSFKKHTSLSWRMATKIIKSQEYPFDLASLERSGFNSSLVTRVIVGGYFAKEDEEWIDEVVKQWLILEPKSNIIKVSWADANRGLYHSAAYNSRIVARQLTLFLYYLDQMFHIDLNKFHLVGHSLGAHIAGFVGADNGGKIARITGLDPAGPIFVELNASMRLDPSDAKFVDVMHTNGGTITKGALGLSIPSGHVDYYCNGGSVQPGCYFSSVTKSIMDPVERVACSHRRSYRYFIEIIKLAQQQQQQREQSTDSDIISSHNLFINNSTLTQSTNNTSEQQQYSIALTNRDSEGGHVHLVAKSSSIIAKLPRAFLFEAKQEDLVKLMQPEISLISHRANSLRRAELNQHPYSSTTAPLKRHLEFHLLNPDFPPGKRGLYFFRTRSESPFFASKQYALTLKTDAVIRRKMALLVRMDHQLVAEVELDEIPGIYTLAFAPNDPKIISLGTGNENVNSVDNLNQRQQLHQLNSNNRIPQLSLMWRHRSFNLLLTQQNELHLNSVELSLLDSDEDERPVIKYSLIPPVLPSLPLSPASIMKSVFSGPDSISMTRNQWYKFEGKILNFRSSGANFYY